MGWYNTFHILQPNEESQKPDKGRNCLLLFTDDGGHKPSLIVVLTDKSSRNDICIK